MKFVFLLSATVLLSAGTTWMHLSDGWMHNIQPKSGVVARGVKCADHSGDPCDGLLRKVTDLRSHPALLKLPNKKRCNGQPISKDVVLTSAHCLVEGVVSVKVSEGLDGSGQAVLQEREVEEVCKLSDWHGKTDRPFDIGLVRLSQPLTEQIEPLGLSSAIPKVARLVGFHNKSPGSTYLALDYGVFRSTDVTISASNYMDRDPKNFICHGARSQTSVSGAALLTADRRSISCVNSSGSAFSECGLKHVEPSVCAPITESVKTIISGYIESGASDKLKCKQ